MVTQCPPHLLDPAELWYFLSFQERSILYVDISTDTSETRLITGMN